MKKRKRITLMKKERKVKRMAVGTRMMMRAQVPLKSQRKRRRRSKKISKGINKR
jgi:hypothetical protein